MFNETDLRHDRLAVRLSVIISRLMAGESLSIKSLAAEFGVSERTLQRDFLQRLAHLDITSDRGCYRLRGEQQPDRSPAAQSFIRNTGIEHIIPAKDNSLLHILSDESSASPCLIWHAPLNTHAALPEFFSRLVRAISQQVSIVIMVDGRRHDGLEPYRLIHFRTEWYLVACRQGSLRVFALTGISSVTLSGRRFTRREDICYFTAGERFISALPHFPLISDVLRTFETGRYPPGAESPLQDAK
ncbi:helix-turn-helix transcriptional regulator [Enterobacter kobei]|uniref:helix-turn-helix transcriptional regulator n=1 Tax=Enterobacter kobei TaxID=208224 RepID=UPI000681A89D|nr:WYL domain-containing protein [Enterobacter kobei]